MRLVRSPEGSRFMGLCFVSSGAGLVSSWSRSRRRCASAGGEGGGASGRSDGACSLEHRFIASSTSICDGVTSALVSIISPSAAHNTFHTHAQTHTHSQGRQVHSRRGAGTRMSDWGDSGSCHACHAHDGAGASKSVMFCQSSCSVSFSAGVLRAKSGSPVSSTALWVLRAANYFRSVSRRVPVVVVANV